MYNEERKSILLNSMLLNAPQEISVDHINGDLADCRKVNLRSTGQIRIIRKKNRSDTEGCRAAAKDTGQ